MKFKERMYRFMQGRNGADAYGRFLNIVGFVCLMLALLFTVLSRGFVGKSETAALVFLILYLVFYAVGVALMVYTLFRMFSRKVGKRQAENTRFLYRQNRLKRKWSGLKQQWKERKTHRYFRCPKCKQKLRAPKGKGKIRITCSKCGEKFINKT